MAEAQQLKKKPFLDAITEEPMTRGDIVDALEAYTFVPTYIDYLTDHFLAQGKIVKNEDGTIQRKSKKVSADREAFKLVADEKGEYSVTQRTLEPGETIDIDAGEATTYNAAIKRYCSAAFQDYKAKTEAAKALVVKS